MLDLCDYDVTVGDRDHGPPTLALCASTVIYVETKSSVCLFVCLVSYRPHQQLGYIADGSQD